MIKDYTAEDLQNAFDRGREIGRKESQRPWVGLTDEEENKLISEAMFLKTTRGIIKRVEAKLKEKNV